jgi:maltose alpha-D-glucosyltransferase/alpha-amylase
VLVFLRRHENEVVLCVNNLSRYAQPVELDLREFSGLVPIELWSCEPFPVIGDLPYFFTMAPHGFLWFRLVAPAEVGLFKRPK